MGVVGHFLLEDSTFQLEKTLRQPIHISRDSLDWETDTKILPQDPKAAMKLPVDFQFKTAHTLRNKSLILL